MLNDNEWSIAKNVGAIASLFEQNRRQPHLRGPPRESAAFYRRIGGAVAVEFAHEVEEGVKNLLVPSVIFEELGFRYYGPIDGHNIPLLTRTFEFLKTQNEPVLLHILTKKGKGYEPALAQPDKFHGLGRFAPDTGKTAAGGFSDLCRDLRVKSVAKFADSNQQDRRHHRRHAQRNRPRLLPGATSTRYFDVGIAEEHAALFAGGLATQGFKPFLAIYSTFMQRAYDMIIHDIALQNLNVALCMDRGGFSGDDGPTHHGLFDIGYLRHIPNIIHMQPKDEDEFVDMLWTIANYHTGPIAIRYPAARHRRGAERTSRMLEIGKAEVVQHGREWPSSSWGTCSRWLGRGANVRSSGISLALINPGGSSRSIPGTLEFFARRADVICTIEDHVLHNGFGCAVIEHLNEHGSLIRPSCASAGPTNSSNTARSRSCGKSTA